MFLGGIKQYGPDPIATSFGSNVNRNNVPGGRARSAIRNPMMLRSSRVSSASRLPVVLCSAIKLNALGQRMYRFNSC